MTFIADEHEKRLRGLIGPSVIAQTLRIRC
jgi:hypothetical protein